jgi:hypothetical protein
VIDDEPVEHKMFKYCPGFYCVLSLRHRQPSRVRSRNIVDGFDSPRQQVNMMPMFLNQ